MNGQARLFSATKKSYDDDPGLYLRLITTRYYKPIVNDDELKCALAKNIQKTRSKNRKKPGIEEKASTMPLARLQDLQ